MDILRTLFHKIYDDALKFVLTKLQAKMAILEALYIRQTADLLTGLLITNDDSKFLQKQVLCNNTVISDIHFFMFYNFQEC